MQRAGKIHPQQHLRQRGDQPESPAPVDLGTLAQPLGEFRDSGFQLTADRVGRQEGQGEFREFAADQPHATVIDRLTQPLPRCRLVRLHPCQQSGFQQQIRLHGSGQLPLQRSADERFGHQRQIDQVDIDGVVVIPLLGQQIEATLQQAATGRDIALCGGLCRGDQVVGKGRFRDARGVAHLASQQFNLQVGETEGHEVRRQLGVQGLRPTGGIQGLLQNRLPRRRFLDQQAASRGDLLGHLGGRGLAFAGRSDQQSRQIVSGRVIQAIPCGHPAAVGDQLGVPQCRPAGEQTIGIFSAVKDREIFERMAGE